MQQSPGGEVDLGFGLGALLLCLRGSDLGEGLDGALNRFLFAGPIWGGGLGDASGRFGFAFAGQTGGKGEGGISPGGNLSAFMSVSVDWCWHQVF